MKVVLTWLLFTASALAQTSSFTVLASPSTVATSSIYPTAFIVQYETTEKCFECTVRYAIACSPDYAACGVPDKQVSHFEEFPDARSALDFINRERANGTSVWSVLGVAPRPMGLPVAASGVLLWSVKKVELTERKTTKEEPQPPKITVETKWSVKAVK